jgi:TonB family protein
MQAPVETPEAPVRVGSILHGEEPLTKVLPALPAEAAARGVLGPVLLEIRITETGDVSVLDVIRGHPLLDELAKTAVEQWKYRPVVINGRPVPTIKVVTVSFVATDESSSARQGEQKGDCGLTGVCSRRRPVRS